MAAMTRRRPARPLAVLLRAGLVAIGVLAGGPRAAALPGGGLEAPRPGSASDLEGLFCTSRANCWAVGSFDPGTANTELNEALHWDGSAWSQVHVPSPVPATPGAGSALHGVRCVSQADCWAVGTYQKGGTLLGEAVHWDGRAWSLARVPQPGGTGSGHTSQLMDVACTSAANCWAVGQYLAGSTTTTAVRNELLRWNGSKWLLATVPDPGGTDAHDISRLASVRCVSAASCVAVGAFARRFEAAALRNQVLRWNGTRWSQSSTPNPGGTIADGDFSQLIGLACVSSTDCWAVGSYGGFRPKQTALTEILHWNGGKWLLARSPQPGGTGSGDSQNLAAASCASGSDCWAVGYYVSRQPNSGFVLDQALHWNGTRWALAATPDPGGTSARDISELLAVFCSSPASCWAAGFGQAGASAPRFGAVLRWDGTGWSVK